MAPLNAQSVAAVARLRAYRSPAFPLWNRLPLSRRAAVLILLYADRHGDLRVVLTMRAASLRNYSGHAAFPGGKADTLDETPEQIARREAWEEIGLPLDGRGILPQQFRIEHLCSLPHNLAKTELVVRPCVALLTAERDTAEAERTEDLQSEDARSIDVERLIPRLDAKEVAAVFSAPFHNFLLATDELEQPEKDKVMAEASGKTQRLRPRLPSGPWYEGVWVDWHETPWRMHYFYVPVVGQRVAKPKKRLRSSSAGKAAPAQQQEASSGDYDDIEEAPGRYKVWGMTARILVDAAQLAYDERPEFEHNAHFGDERILEGLEQMGRLGEKLRKELTNKDAKDASKM
ncbi:nudix domain containing protein [Grosmannia clavigera kw1407]|uniref:Nudix domain containing protein n=1 Tax=Grosmannia clavigera (strain kw1407 / UAMH 11150) TaxID=655863 RepID=F0XHG9_GROCL|nr:nudix domain containing protein [Grosmannia clavigera kw1407]EFX02770.1 nudix domain containing protein [Grosmannia clavigera kw1407]